MSLSQWASLCNSIASTTIDYRHGEVPAATPEHVDRWARQFALVGLSQSEQLELLAEIDHVLKQTYFSKATVETFLDSVASVQVLVGQDPVQF